jgi:hypothetical protein
MCIEEDDTTLIVFGASLFVPGSAHPALGHPKERAEGGVDLPAEEADGNMRHFLSRASMTVIATLESDHLLSSR